MSRNLRGDSSVHNRISNDAEQLLAAALGDGDGPTKPWSIKGIDEATVQLCKLAARGKGMKINRWVSDALREAAQRQFVEPGDPKGAEAERTIDQRGAISERLSRLEGEVSALAKSHAAFIAALATRA